jgi:peptidoglycan/LPS O-acetylase OafA/YrhL
MLKNSDHYIPQLTFLRFLAAIVIVIFHYGLFTSPFNHPYIIGLVKQGSVAVSFFFFLSGLVLTISYWKINQLNYGKFLLKRFARIYPVYLVAFLITLLLVLFVNHQKPHGISIILQALGLHAWFPGICLEINFPGWSIAVEIFFYVLFPLFIVAFKRLKFIKTAITVLIVWTVSAWLHYYLRIHLIDPKLTGNGQLIAYFPVWHLNTFLFGMLAGMAILQLKKTINNLKNIFRLFYLSGTVLFLIILGTDNPIKPLMHNGILSPLFFMIIFSFAMDSSFITRIFSHKIAILLGNASYSMYILQFPVYICFTKIIRLERITGNYFYGYLVILIAISILCYLLFETKLQTFLNKKWKLNQQI